MPENKNKNTVPSLPVEDILVSVAESVVQAQQVMDEQSLASEVRIRSQELDKNFGISANWYTIPELDLDLRLAFEVGSRGEMKTQMVDAEYQAKYGFDLKAASLLQTKITAAPPSEASGLSLLDEATVLKTTGRLKKIAEAWGRSDTPHFAVRYLPFVRQGYNGGLWFVNLMDRMPGAVALRAMVVVDDETSNVVRIWSDETEAPCGVEFTSEEAFKAVIAVNKATEEELESKMEITAGPLAFIMEQRPFDSVAAIADIDGVGKVTMTKILDYIKEREV